MLTCTIVHQGRNTPAVRRRSVLLVALSDAIHATGSDHSGGVCRMALDTDIFKPGHPRVGLFFYLSSSRRETHGPKSVELGAQGETRADWSMGGVRVEPRTSALSG